MKPFVVVGKSEVILNLVANNAKAFAVRFSLTPFKTSLLLAASPALVKLVALQLRPYSMDQFGWLGFVPWVSGMYTNYDIGPLHSTNHPVFNMSYPKPTGIYSGASESQKELAFAAGAQVYLAKPVGTENLIPSATI